MKSHEENKSDATLLLKEIENPKQYGVANVKEDSDVINVRSVIEKPKKPLTNLAIMPIYVFNKAIFEALEMTKPGLAGEIQLTDAIQHMIEGGFKVQAIKLRNDEKRLDVGNPETYWDAAVTSFEQSYKI